MKKKNIGSSILWLLFSVIVCIESYKLNIGTLHNPGPGFYPFCIGLTLILFSLIVLLSSIFLQKEEASQEKTGEKSNIKDILLVVISLFLYAIVYEHLGFVLSTFLFIIFILKIIERKKWLIAISFAIFTAAISYVVFNLWLNANLPKGILGI